jgi:Tol biopolymer transport system component
VGQIWILGDFTIDNATQLGRHVLSAATTVSLALPGRVDAFAVAPGAQRVAVALDAEVTGRYDLWIFDADGSNPQKLATMPTFTTGITTTFGGVSSIVFSPNGQQIAYLADVEHDNARDVWTVPAGGGTPVKRSPNRPTTNPADTQLQPKEYAWSRDSAKLAFTGDYEVDRALQLYIADLASNSTLTAVTNAQVGAPPATTNSVGATGNIAWTSGGRLLFKAKLASDTGFRLYGIDSGGANLAVLPNSPAGPGQLGSIGLSPDGLTVAFSADTLTTNAYEIYTMPVTGSVAPVRITTGTIPGSVGQGPAFYRPLKWSPDGTQIAFIADIAVNDQFDLYVVPVSGGGEIRLVAIGGATNFNQDCEDVFWSPDSSALTFYADHRSNNNAEAFRLIDLTTPLQTPVTVQSVPVSGDVFDLDWTL